MKHNTPLSDRPWVQGEMQALRAETPDPGAVDRAVLAVQAVPSPSRKPRSPWVVRSAALATGLAAMAVMLSVSTQDASAASLRLVAAALKSHTCRYQKTLRPDGHGTLKMTGELWLQGEKHFATYLDKNGTSITGYDGKRMFVYYPNSGAFIDDTEPVGYPVEDLDTYLRIPNGKILRTEKGVLVDGARLDLYSLGFGGMRFDLYIDPATRLPVRRDVMGLKGGLIEQNLYQYPASIPDSRFAPPMDKGIPWCDYPAVRAEVARKLEGPGQTQEVAGVRISLKTVIVGQHEILAVWTGGTRAGLQSEGQMIVRGIPPTTFGGPRPEPFGLPSPVPLNHTLSPITVRGERLYGDAVWPQGPFSLKAPVTIDIPVWATDRTRPWKGNKGEDLGFQSKVVGRMTFVVADPVYAEDPERVLWRPEEGAQTGTASS